MVATQPATLAYVVSRLAAAGATELLLCERGTRPAGYRCAMPEPLRDWEDYGRGEPRLSRPVPSARAISEWEEARGWISRAVPDDAVRRVVGLRMLTWWPGHPRDGEPVHSWRRIGQLLGMDHKTAKARFECGCGRIVVWLRWRDRPAGAGLCTMSGGLVRRAVREAA